MKERTEKEQTKKETNKEQKKGKSVVILGDIIVKHLNQMVGRCPKR